MKEIDAVDAGRFRQHVKNHDLLPFAHIPYLCNLASPRDEIRKKSATMLAESMRACARLGIDGLVIHMGSHLGSGKSAGMKNLVEGICDALETEKSTSILLENSSGYANSIGSSVEEIGAVIREVGSDRVGVCFDTCHAFASGYDLSSPRQLSRLEAEFEKEIGKERLKLVHLNDSKYPLGSKLDRHWHIGKGYIGFDGFVNFLSSEVFNIGTFIMETPVNSATDDASNVSALLRVLDAVELKRRRAPNKE